MVIEAAVERLDIKQNIFVDLERACRADCVLATNTSTINLDLISDKMRARDRVVGAHFFSPAHIMPLLEIVRTSHSSPQVRSRRLGGSVLAFIAPCQDCPLCT
jgi:enoyl-CoA hydratase/3-hydroxyacyl-CoA dehydrogenase